MSGDKRIAILGATSHIAKGLTVELSAAGEYELFLFARSPERVEQFLDSTGAAGRRVRVAPFSEFPRHDYDAVINCVGIGSPARLARELQAIFAITETFDNLALEYLENHRTALYLNFSSGAAYGTDFSHPVGASSQARFAINALKSEEYYGIAKINAEAKHRALSGYNIVDLRVFGYFSRFVDLGETFLMSELVASLRDKRELVTNNGNIVRDFVVPQDLSNLVKACMSVDVINDVFDVYSARPAAKFDILDHFARHHGLNYRVENRHAAVAVTGHKDNYYSTCRKARTIGYEPTFDTIAGIEHETAYLLQ